MPVRTLLFCFLLPLVAASAPFCADLTKSQTSARPVTELLRKIARSQIDKKLIQTRDLSVLVFVSPMGSRAEAEGLRVELYHQGHLGVTVSLKRVEAGKKSVRAFESHSQSEPGFDEKGLGSLAYLLAARIAQKELDAEVYSSLSPSDDARRIWNRFVQSGWAQSVSNPFENQYVSYNQTTSRFRFRKDLLQGDHFQELEAVLKSLQFRLML